MLQVDDLLSDGSESDETLVGEANTAVDFLLVNSDSDSDSDAVHIVHTNRIPFAQLSSTQQSVPMLEDTRNENTITDMLSRIPTSNSSNTSFAVTQDPNPNFPPTTKDTLPSRGCKPEAHDAPALESYPIVPASHDDDCLIKAEPPDISASAIEARDPKLTSKEHPEGSKTTDAISNISNGSGSPNSDVNSTRSTMDNNYTWQLSRLGDDMHYGGDRLQPIHASSPDNLQGSRHAAVHHVGVVVQRESRSADEHEQEEEEAGSQLRSRVASGSDCSSVGSEDDELEAILMQPPPEVGPQEEVGAVMPSTISVPEASNAGCADSNDHEPPHVRRLREASARERRLVGEETMTTQAWPRAAHERLAHAGERGNLEQGAVHTHEHASQRVTQLVALELEARAGQSDAANKVGTHESPTTTNQVQGLSAAGRVLTCDHAALSLALASSAHGTPGTVAFHVGSGAAVGMSDGSVLLAGSADAVSGQQAPRTTAKAGGRLHVLINANSGATAVTALAFSPRGDWLLAGHQDGLVVLWDTARAAVGKELKGVHKSSVCAAAFLLSPALGAVVGSAAEVITADAGGMVLKHAVSTMGPLVRCKTTTIGERTFLHAAVALPVPFPRPSGVATEGASGPPVGVVAMVTSQMIIVVRLDAEMEVVSRIATPCSSLAWSGIEPPPAQSEMTAPCVAWRIEGSGQPPTLAVACGGVVRVLALSPDDGRTTTRTLATLPGTSAVVALHWLGQHILAAITSEHQVWLMDATLNVLDKVVLTEPHAASCSMADKTIILGCSQVRVLRLVPLRERLSLLQESHDWGTAWTVALEAHSRHNNPALVMDLLTHYLRYLPRTKSESDPPSLGSVRAMGCVAVEVCLYLGQQSFLFQEAFRAFQAARQLPEFLEVLVPYILRDRVCSLAPEVMQALVDHFAALGNLTVVEQCVLHMDIASLDFNQVARVCKTHALHSALIHIFNRGLDDFIAPIEELMPVSNLPRNEHLADADAHAVKLLVYLQECFQGHWFPPGRGDLPARRVPMLRAQLLAFLLQPLPSTGEQQPIASRLHRLLLAEPGATCFVLEELFSHWDTTEAEMVGALSGYNSIAGFDTDASTGYNSSAAGARSASQAVMEALLAYAEDSDALNTAEVREHVMQYVVTLVATGRATVEASVLNKLFVYLARPAPEQLADPCTTSVAWRALAEASMAAILRSTLASEMRRHLPGDRASHSHPSRSPSQDAPMDVGWVDELAGKAGFSVVQALVRTWRGDVLGAVDVLLKSPHRPTGAFEYVSAMLDGGFMPNQDPFASWDAISPTGADGSNNAHSRHHRVQFPSGAGAAMRECCTAQATLELRAQILQDIPRLMKVHPSSTSRLLETHFRGQRKHVLERLAHLPQLQFAYLKGIVQKARAPPEKELPAGLPPISSTVPQVLSQEGLDVTQDISELYVEHLCQLEPQSVKHFLGSCDTYRVEKCLQLCQQHGVADASAFLLERIGNMSEALDIFLDQFDASLADLRDRLSKAYCSTHKHETAAEVERALFRAWAALDAATSMCRRSALRTEEGECESLWFRVLDRCLAPLRHDIPDSSRVKQDAADMFSRMMPATRRPKADARARAAGSGQKGMRGVLQRMMEAVMASMAGSVPTAHVLHRIVHDNRHDCLGYLRSAVSGALSSCGYERAILHTAKGVLQTDAYRWLESRHTALRKAITLTPVDTSINPEKNALTICSFCSRPIQIDKLAHTHPAGTASLCVLPNGRASHLSCSKLPTGDSQVISMFVCKQTTGGVVSGVHLRSEDEVIPILPDSKIVEKGKQKVGADSVHGPRHEKHALARMEMFQMLKSGQGLDVMMGALHIQ